MGSSPGTFKLVTRRLIDTDNKMADEEGKKFAKYDDIVEKCKAAVATPDSQGTYADYLELLKLYDKNSNGTMMLAELDNILCNLGDEVPKADVQNLFAELCDPE